jgi:transcriptional regulator with XRE-family HTH domain
VTAGGSWAARRLRALREIAGLTQEQLADRAGIRREVLNAIENNRGRPLSATYRERLAPHLGVTPDELKAPAAEVALPDDPLVLLQGLLETTGGLTGAFDALEERVKALELAAEAQRRAAEEH